MLNIGVVIGLIKKLAPVASPEVIAQAVNDYLDDHPEIEVADGSITEEKLAADVALTLSTLESDVSDVKNAIQGIAEEGIITTNYPFQVLQGNYSSNDGVVVFDTSDYCLHTSFIDLHSVPETKEVVIEIPSNLKVYAQGFDHNDGTYVYTTVISSWQTGGKIRFFVTSSNRWYVCLKIAKSNSSEIVPADATGVRVYTYTESYAKKEIEKTKIEDNVLRIPEQGQILYNADTSANSDHIVNALAYKDGTIIAARSEGTVERINNDGTIDTLLTITGYLMDWRLMWMDSDENVYVSPHATRGSMTLSQRGLYRLEKGENAFVKVISLYDSGSSVPTEAEENNDTIWTMCEDDNGNLYAGVYAHSIHANPAIYKSTDGGITWAYFFNFNTAGLTTDGRHMHTVIYSKWQKALYAIVGEINKIWKSTNGGSTWTDIGVTLPYDKGSSMLALPYGILIGSDGAYQCAVNLLYPDDKTYKTVYVGWANTVFAIRRSDLTGFIYAFCKIDSSALSQKYFPPYSVLSLTGAAQEAAIQAWRVSDANPVYDRWKEYHDDMVDKFPEDAIIPTHYAILISRDGGRSFEVLKKYDSAESGPDGFWTTGQFINGEVLTGHYTTTGGYINPVVISEGKHNYGADGCDLEGEIFIRTNSGTDVDVLPVLTEKTVTGNPVTFKTNTRKKLEKFVITFEPEQADNGNISGFTGAVINHSGNDTSNPAVYNITFTSAGTVYKATYNVITGELTALWLLKQYNGTEDWNVHGSAASWFYVDNTLTDPYAVNADYDFAISNRYEQENYSASIYVSDKKFMIGYPTASINRLVVKDTDYATTDAFKAGLASNPLQVCYKLDTPIVYNLDPLVFNTLLGINKIWSNSNGTTEIKYQKYE